MDLHKLNETLIRLKSLIEVDPSLRPPSRWVKHIEKKIKKNNPGYDSETVSKTMGNIWYNLSTDKKKEIRGREGKHYGPAEGTNSSSIKEGVEKIDVENEIRRLSREIDDWEWYIKKQKDDINGPYSGVYSSGTKKFKREEIARLRKYMADNKEKIKELQGILKTL